MIFRITYVILLNKEGEGSLSFLERQMRGIPALPLGTAFELLAAVTLNAVIAVLAVIKKETNDDMKKEHINVTQA